VAHSWFLRVQLLRLIAVTNQTPQRPANFGLPPSVAAGPGRARPHGGRGAFTLIELLSAIAVIAILVSITVGITRGVLARSQIARAMADLATLAMALEQYKLQYGDYPWTPPQINGTDMDGGAILFNALCGNLGPKGNVLTTKGRSFVELSRFTLAHPEPTDPEYPQPDSTSPVFNWFNDPWPRADGRNWYYYAYRKGEGDLAWTSPSYLLYSHGPDGACDIGQAQNTGLIADVPADPQNEDNLYAGRDS